MKNNLYLLIVARIAPIILFLLLSYAYHSPLLEGKRLQQHDLSHFKGMSKEVSDYRESAGEESLWTNSMFSGMPTYLIGVKWTGNIFNSVNKLIQIGPRPGSYTFITMLGMYIALLMFGINPWISIIGAIAFGFSSYNIIILSAGHNSKAVALAYLPVVISSIYYTFHKKRLIGLGVFGIAMSLEILAGHPQITYYGFLIVLIYGLYELIFIIKKNDFKSKLITIVGLLIVLLLSIGTHIGNLYSTYEYGKYSIRGASELSHDAHNQTSGLDKDYATEWSYGKMETFNLLIPNLFGGASGSNIGTDSHLYNVLKQMGVPNARDIVERAPTYWGPQTMGTSGPVYIGAVVIFLFVLGLFLVKGQMRWWLLTVTIVSILLAWGRNFMWLTDLFLDYFPGYNKFRTVSMILVMAQFAIPTLGILAVNRLLNGKVEKDEFISAFKKTGYIVGGILLFFLVFGKVILSFSSEIDSQVFGNYSNLVEALRKDRAHMMISDTLRSLFFVAATAGAIWFFFTKKFKQTYFIAVLGLLILVDLWAVDKRYLNSDNFVSKRKAEEPYQPTQADVQILQDPDPHYRVFNVTVSPFQDASTSYFHKSIGGYHGAKMRRYQELYEHQIVKNNMAVLNMLNAKYFIVPGDQGPQAQLNPDALGNAWFVNNFEVVENADAEIDALSDFDPSETAIIDQRFASNLNGFEPVKDSASTIKLLEYRPNYLKYESNNSGEGLAVFSEIYYPHGWYVKIDGKEATHFRVNYVLRAMRIPAGTHTIEFSFDPPLYQTGTTISRISSILLLLLLIGAIGWEVKKGLNTKNENE